MFLLFTVRRMSFLSTIHIDATIVLIVATSRAPQSTVLNMLRLFGKIEPKIDQIRAWLSRSTRSPEPPQKFSYGPYFAGQLLSRNQFSQKNRVNPSPLINVKLNVPNLSSIFRPIQGFKTHYSLGCYFIS